MADERKPQQPQTKDNDSRVSALEAEIAQLKQLILAQNQATTQLSQQHASFTGILEKEIAKNQQREAEFKDITKHLNRPAQVRSQEIANERYPAAQGTKPFFVKVLGAPKNEDEYGRPVVNGPRLPNGGLPELKINAQDRAGAIGRYSELCGIRIKEGAEIVAEEIAPVFATQPAA